MVTAAHFRREAYPQVVDTTVGEKGGSHREGHLPFRHGLLTLAWRSSDSGLVYYFTPRHGFMCTLAARIDALSGQKIGEEFTFLNFHQGARRLVPYAGRHPITSSLACRKTRATSGWLSRRLPNRPDRPFRLRGQARSPAWLRLVARHGPLLAPAGNSRGLTLPRPDRRLSTAVDTCRVRVSSLVDKTPLTGCPSRTAGKTRTVQIKGVA